MNVRKRNARLASVKLKSSYMSYVTSREYGRKGRCIGVDQAPLSDRLPLIWDGRSLPLSYEDKVFASQWISNEELLIGTKCNHFGLLNCRTCKIIDIPLLEETEKIESQEQVCGCGIHAIQKNPSQTFVATGGKNVTTIGVYRLPDLTPECIFQKQHKNCVFDLRWIDDAHLASCSRDSCLALWRLPCADTYLPSLLNHDPGSLITNPRPVPSHASLNTPVGYAISTTPNDRFRALEYLPTRNMLAVVSMSRRFYLYDIDQLFSSHMGTQKPINKMPLLSSDKEAVALRRWPSNPQVVSLATHRSVLLFDIRCRSQIRRMVSRSIKPPSSYHSCVRSLNFSGNILSYGTSAGKVYFYDLVADNHLPSHLDIESQSRQFNSPPCSHFNYSDPSSDDSLPDLASDLGQNNTNGVSEEEGEDTESNEMELSFEFSGDAFPSFRRANIRLATSNSPEMSTLDRRLLVYLQSATPQTEHHQRSLNQIRRAAAALRRRVVNTAIQFTADAVESEENMAVRLSSDEEGNEDESDDGVDLSMPSGSSGIWNQPPLFENSELLQNLGFDTLNWAREGSLPALGTSVAVYTHEYDPTGTRLFTAGGPIGSAFSGNFAVVWD
ncbi:unnamed protein product [Mesocestoides corti]|uniref:WD_REPEATS_REGION domain-containing protein n=2 Tax=Mesocestoides corti TaxID=53468 RepID=A0A0R3UEY1_MESCO|nr:unnamed protein product [Mesocestoides corti]